MQLDNHYVLDLPWIHCQQQIFTEPHHLANAVMPAASVHTTTCMQYFTKIQHKSTTCAVNVLEGGCSRGWIFRSRKGSLERLLWDSAGPLSPMIRHIRSH